MLALLLLAACGGEPAQDECQQICDELILQCGYQAFPSRDSCLQGCLYDDQQGADTQGWLECVQDAACDTFAVIDCEHDYGP